MSEKADLGQLLGLAAVQWHRRLREDVAARGFPFFAEARSEVLAHVPAEGLPQAALAPRMGMSKQAVQQFIDQLVADGVVTREANPIDKRLKTIRLTELGLRARQEADRIRQSIDTDIRVAIGDKGYRRLRKTLRKMVAPE
ncbi:MAG TPA: MarR family transcriptional regulator [Devosia sp.]